MNTSDRICLRGLRAWGYHGVLPQERSAGQEFIVDVDLEVASMDNCAASDDLADTVDYGAVAVGIVDLIKGDPVDLIETLAVRIARFCLTLDGVRVAVVTVHKPAAPIPTPFSDVAVQVTRYR